MLVYQRVPGIIPIPAYPIPVLVISPRGLESTLKSQKSQVFVAIAAELQKRGSQLVSWALGEPKPSIWEYQHVWNPPYHVLVDLVGTRSCPVFEA